MPSAAVAPDLVSRGFSGYLYVELSGARFSITGGRNGADLGRHFFVGFTLTSMTSASLLIEVRDSAPFGWHDMTIWADGEKFVVESAVKVRLDIQLDDDHPLISEETLLRAEVRLWFAGLRCIKTTVTLGESRLWVRPSVLPMPSTEEIDGFFEVYTAPVTVEPLSNFNSTGVSGDDLATWWSLVASEDFDEAFDAEDGNPIGTAFPSAWVSVPSASEATLINLACRLLSSMKIATFVSDLKNASGKRTLPSIGSDGEPTVCRSLLDRLFDRLHINFGRPILFSEDDDPVHRMADWYASNGYLQPPVFTKIGMVSERSPYYKFRHAIGDGDFGSPLADFAAVSPIPENFTLPLQWDEACYSGLFPYRLTPEDGIRDKLKELGDGLRTLGGGLADGSAITRLVGLGVGGVLGGVVGPGIALAAELVGVSLLDLGENLDEFGTQMRAAAETADSYHDLLAGVLGGLREVELYSLLGSIDDATNAGLDQLEFVTLLRTEGLISLQRALSTEPVGTLEYLGGAQVISTMYHQISPVIMLGDSIKDYATQFDSFRNGTMEETGSSNEFWGWYDIAVRMYNERKRVVDVACVFDTASLILEQLIYIDDELMNMIEVSFTEGLVGSAVRKGIQESGFSDIFEALGGVSPARILRLLVRQIFTDFFIAELANEENTSCLYSVFCWMGNSEKRYWTNRALGPVVSGTLLPRDLYAGALGRLILAISEATDLDAMNDLLETIDRNDLYAISKWAKLADASCLDGLWDYSYGPLTDAFFGR